MPIASEIVRCYFGQLAEQDNFVTNSIVIGFTALTAEKPLVQAGLRKAHIEKILSYVHSALVIGIVLMGSIDVQY